MLAGDRARVAALIEAGAPVEARDKDWTALHWALWAEKADAAKLLLDAGADIEARGGEGRWTALHMAASYGKTDTVEILLERGKVESAMW